MNKKYKVHLAYTSMVTVEVDAFDEQEAYDKALEEEVDIANIKDNLHWDSFHSHLEIIE